MGIGTGEILAALSAGKRPARDLREIGYILDTCYHEVRHSEAQVLEEMFRAELESRTLEETLAKLTPALRGYARADEARIWFPVALPRTLSKPICFEVKGSDRRVLDPSWTVRSCWSIPLGHSGVIQLGFIKKYPWLSREIALLSIAAERCSAVVERVRMVHDLEANEARIRRLSHRLVEVEERERRRISRELHDEAGQSLLCIRLSLEVLEQELGADSPFQPKVKQTRELAEKAVTEIRRILSALNPEVLEKLGLAAAVRQLGKRAAIPGRTDVVVKAGKLPPVPESVALVIYRLAQECVTNAVKHANPRIIKVSLDYADSYLRLTVIDDGSGFALSEARRKRGAYGLAGIEERVTLFGGVCEIQSQVARGGGRHGTKTEIRIPLGNEKNATDSRSIGR
jgi:signal transduction histidine kinase